MIKSTNNELLKFIRFFVSFWQIHWSLCCKKYQHYVLPSSSSKVLHYLIVLHLRNTSYDYSLALVKKTISHKKQTWKIWSDSGIVIWWLLPELSLVQLPILPLQLFGCLILALQNLHHKLILARISIHSNQIYFYIHPKLLSHYFKSLLNMNDNCIQNVVQNQIIQIFHPTI